MLLLTVLLNSDPEKKNSTPKINPDDSVLLLVKKISFLFNTEFYNGISKDTTRMLFRGLAMLKSTKLITKGGLCYGFAMVMAL